MFKRKEPENIPEPVPALAPEPEIGPQKAGMTCARCGHHYEAGQFATVEQRKCCPECFAPSEWKA